MPESMTPFEALVAPHGIDIVATRRGLHRSSALLTFGFVVVLGLAAATVWLWQAQHERVGGAARAAATVTAVTPRPVAREHHAVGDVDLSYTAGGALQTARVAVGLDVDRYHDGDQVTVAFDPSVPGSPEIVGESGDDGAVPWQVPASFAVLLLVLLAMLTAQRRATVRILRTHSWLAVPAARHPLPSGFVGEGTTVVVLGEPGGDQVLGAPTGLRRLPDGIEPTAWVAGWGEGRFVVAPPGGSPLVAMRRVRRRPTT